MGIFEELQESDLENTNASGRRRGRKAQPRKMIAGVIHQFCSMCKKWKPLDGFSPVSGKPDRKRAACKSCRWRDSYKKRLANRGQRPVVCSDFEWLNKRLEEALAEIKKLSNKIFNRTA